MQTLSASARVQKTTVKFDATRPRPRSRPFGLGLISAELAELLRPPTDEEITAVFSDLPEVQQPEEPEFESDSVARAYEAGQRIGRARIDASKVRFSGWGTAEISWFWSGYTLGWDTETDRRLAEQAEHESRQADAFGNPADCWNDAELLEARA